MWIVNKVNINTRCSVSISRKVLKSVFVSVSTNVFQTPAPDILNVTNAPPYQHLNSTKNISKYALSVSAAAFIPAPVLTVNLVMPVHGCNILVSVSTTFHVNNMSPYIPLSVNARTPLVDYVSHNVRHVQRRKCMSLNSKVSVTSKYQYVSLSPLYTIFVAILFNTFSFTQSTKAILVCNIFSYSALFLSVYIRFYTKNGGRLIYYIAKYKHFFTCF